MRVEDAAKWYVLMLARLPRMLESVSDLAQKIGLGWRIRSEIREAAARAMYDQSRKKDFFAKLPLPLLEELQSLEPAEAMKKLVSVTQAEVQSIPGTLVETTGMQYWDGHQTWVMTEDGWTIKV